MHSHPVMVIFMGQILKCKNRIRKQQRISIEMHHTRLSSITVISIFNIIYLVELNKIVHVD